jgi:hypothetical protein
LRDLAGRRGFDAVELIPEHAGHLGLGFLLGEGPVREVGDRSWDSRGGARAGVERPRHRVRVVRQRRRRDVLGAPANRNGPVAERQLGLGPGEHVADGLGRVDAAKPLQHLVVAGVPLADHGYVLDGVLAVQMLQHQHFGEHHRVAPVARHDLFPVAAQGYLTTQQLKLGHATGSPRQTECSGDLVNA